MRTKAAPRRFQEQFDSREQEGFFRDVAGDLADLEATIAGLPTASEVLAIDNRLYALELLNLVRVAFAVWTWDGSAMTVRASSNLQISRASQGIYSVSFASGYWSNEYYGLAGSLKRASGASSSSGSVCMHRATAPTVNGCVLAINMENGTLFDAERVMVLFYGIKGA